MGVDGDALAVSLDNLKVHLSPGVLDPNDPAFAVEPEFRPTLKHDEFFVSPADQIPVVDLSPVLSGNEEGLQKVVEEIRKAAEDWGFFQVVNHGVPPSVMDNLEKETLAFFALPLEEKCKVNRTFEQPLGYYHQELTKNRRDWKEVFDYIVRDSVTHKSEDGLNEYSLQSQWPEQPADLRDACQKYAKATETLAFELLGLLSLSLNLPQEYFHKHFIHHTSPVRLNFYPPCPIPSLALGVSRHKDPGVITVLFQDETGGLQVRRRDGEWIGVKPRRDAFVINLGDIFQVWSNDKFHSIEHRVVVNESKRRYSFPMFFNPNSTTDIFPVPELVDDQHPPRYRTFNYGYFMRKRVDGNYHQDGKDIQIDDFAINRDNTFDSET